MNDKRKKHLESVLPELIKAYNSSYKKQYIDGLNECNKVLMAENLTNTEKARYMLKGSHHYRMPDKDNVSQILGDACLWECKYHNFEKVYEAVENTIGELYGVGPLALYDVSVRIAYCCGIEPKSYVYLQCGALEGAKRLLDDKKLRVGTIDATCFEELLPGLSPLHVENFLCHMQDDFLDESERKKEPRKRRGNKYGICVMLIGLLFSLLTPLSALADVTIDEEHFPDEKFRNWLLAQDYGQDEVITDDEIAQITKIDVSYRGISTLEGIQHFTALTSLSCSGNPLTELDVTQNTALRYLSCYWNQLTELDVSNCTALTDLDCWNNQLTSLDVSKNTALTDLECSSNQLTALDVTQNTTLETLYCYSNQLTALDVSNNTALTELRCHSNQLTSLDVSKNTALTDLRCHSNQLTSLDVSKNTALETLYCWNNKIYGKEMDQLIESLPNSSGKIYIFDSYSGIDGNICTWNQANAIKAKGWTPYYIYDTSGYYSTNYDGLREWNVEMHEGQDEYWATLYAPFGYTLPADAEAYTGVVNEETQSLVLTSIGSNVPKGTPVIIKGNSASVVAEVDDDITAEVGDNDLIGMYEPFDATGTDVYTLGIYEDIVGFYKYNGTTGRFKAVLELTKGIAANGYRMVFEDDDITAIDDANAIVDNANAVYYDLQGRRVAEPQRGQLYIVNGKTVLYQP